MGSSSALAQLSAIGASGGATELVLQGMPAQVKHAETSFAEQLG